VQYVVVPALHDFPRIPHTTKIDIREWVRYGHTFILLGGSVNIYLMNEIFGLRLEPQVRLH
jgi:hypothetical protein